MKAKLAGHSSLAEMMSQQIEAARTKLASVSGVETPAEESTEETVKVASSNNIDFNNLDEIEKLASALDAAVEKLAADEINHGDESNQGGVQLPVMAMNKGKQSYKKDSPPKHDVPKNTGMQVIGDGGKSKTLVPNNENSPSFLHQPYPKKGVMKTAADIEELKKRAVKAKEESDKTGKMAVHKYPEETEKKSSAIEFLLGKIAQTRASGESAQGGMTLDSMSGEGIKPPTGGTNSARSALESNSAPAKFTKRDAKKIQKPSLAEVLTEPAFSKAKDNKVQENLRNADKGGVKIAAAKAYLQKIAEAGCTCDGNGSCKYCVMKSKMAKKS